VDNSTENEHDVEKDGGTRSGMLRSQTTEYSTVSVNKKPEVRTAKLWGKGSYRTSRFIYLHEQKKVFRISTRDVVPMIRKGPGGLAGEEEDELQKNFFLGKKMERSKTTSKSGREGPHICGGDVRGGRPTLQKKGTLQKRKNRGERGRSHPG